MDTKSTLTIRVAVSNVSVAMAQIRGMTALLKGVPSQITALVGGVSFVALARSGINFADTLGKVSQMVGVTTKALSGMAYAANQDEIEIGGLRIALKEFSEHLSKTGQGSKNLKDALLEQSEIFQRLPDGVAKSTRAVQLFGKAGMSMIPLLNKGPEDLQKLFERGEKLNGVNDNLASSADAFNDGLTDLRTSTRGLATDLVSDFLPALTSTINKITDAITAFREWKREHPETFKTGVEAVGFGSGVLGASFLGGKAVGMMSKVVGPIKSISDLTAGISLLGAQALRTAGPIAVIVGGLFAFMKGVKEFVAMMSAHKQSLKSDADTAKAMADMNRRLSESLREDIEQQLKAGTITAEAAETHRGFIENAMRNPAEAAGRLRVISQALMKTRTRETPPTQWTQDRLEDASKILETEIRLSQLSRERNELESERLSLGMKGMTMRAFEEIRLINEKDSIRQLSVEQDALHQKRSNAAQALQQAIITQIEFDKIDLEIRKDLLAIEKESVRIADAPRQRYMSAVRSDFTLTDAQKFDKLSEVARTPEELNALGPNPNSIGDQMIAASVALQNQLGTLAQNIGATFSDVIMTAVNSISDGISGLILQTKTWGQALSQIGTSILTSVVQGIVQIGVRWVATTLLMAATTKGVAAASTAALAPIAAAQAAIWATPATLSTIASYGASAAAAPGFIEAAKGIVMGLSVTPREHGGPVTAGMPYIVGEKRPELFVPRESGYILPSVPSITASPSFAGPSASNNETNVHVHYWDDKSAMVKHMKENPAVRHVIVDIMRQESHQIQRG